MLLLLPAGLFSQSIVTGAVSGTVTDPSGAVVISATVTLTNPSTGITQSTNTNSSGLYTFPLLKPGAYTVTVTQSGFKKATKSVTVDLGQTTAANIRLALGNTSETVEVSATGGLLQTEDANLTTNIGVRQIENLPNPGNDITYIAQTAPGVAMNNATGNGYGNFSAFGMPGTSNLFTINGNDYNDPFLNLNNSGASNLLLGGNEVQEVAVVSNGYTGQYGRQAGAQIDYSTKSGANAFHGDASYSWTGRAMDANDWFNNFNGAPRPFQNNNQWAASIGGPIKKNKAFFFVNTEGLRYIFGTSTSVFVPDPAFQSVVLANLPAASVPFYQQMFGLYNAAPGINRAVPSAGSCTAPPMGATGAVANFFTTNGTCLDTFRDTTSNGNKEWLLSARVDINLTDKDKLFGRWKMDRGTQPTYTDPINPIFNADSVQPQDEGQLNYTHTFTPNVVNNFIGSVLYYSAIFGSPDLSAGLATFPYIVTSSNSSLTALGVGGSDFPVGFLFPQGRNVTQWQLVDDVSWSKGKHNLKFGGNFRRDDVSDHTASEQPFPAMSTSLYGFATGLVDTSVTQNFAVSGTQPIAFSSWGLYGQDQWKVTPNLTLTLTLRADRNTPGTCQNGCTSLTSQPFNSSNFDHSASTPYDQMMVSSKQILRSIQDVVFEPRVGFAYNPWGGSTVIRGGGGLFTDLYPGTILDNFTTNFPEENRFAVPGSFPLSPAMAGNAAATILGCNSGFTSNFHSGGTVTSYLNANPGCGLPNLNDVAQNFKNPEYAEWNFEIEHAFRPSTSLTINYVGNYGYNLIIFNPNLNGFGFGGLPAAAADTRVLQTNQYSNPGTSNYNGVTMTLMQRMWHGFTGSINYTWAHSLDDVSNGGVLPYSIYSSITNQINPLCLRCLNYSSSDYDARQNITASYVWNLPFKSSNSFLNQAIGGWTLSETFFRRTGLPFSTIDGVQSSNLVGNNLGGSTILAYPSGAGQLPTTCGAPAVSGGAIVPCLPSSLFLPAGSVPGFGGTVRNQFRGPSYFNTDLTVRKNFKITERVQFSFAAIFYNILNHPNFGNPYDNMNVPGLFGSAFTTISPPTTPYGAFASAAEDARIVQFNGKITF
jgi:hypothetical protein